MPPLFWESKENERRFLDEVATKYNLESVSDWRKVTASLIKKCGGQGLLKKYKGSLAAALKRNYPGEWNIPSNSSFFKSQDKLHLKLGKLLPRNYLKQNLKNNK